MGGLERKRKEEEVHVHTCSVSTGGKADLGPGVAEATREGWSTAPHVLQEVVEDLRDVPQSHAAAHEG